MFRFITVLLLALTSYPLYAQEQEQQPESEQPQSSLKYFFTRQDCYPLRDFYALVSMWRETPLFTGTGLTYSKDGEPFQGGTVFFVNTDTGSWTLATIYADQTVCFTAAGKDFVPYTEN